MPKSSNATQQNKSRTKIKEGFLTAPNIKNMEQHFNSTLQADPHLNFEPEDLSTEKTEATIKVLQSFYDSLRQKIQGDAEILCKSNNLTVRTEMTTNKRKNHQKPNQTAKIKQ